MSTELWIALIGVGGVIIGGMISVIFQWIISRNLNNSNARKAQADTAALYQQIADVAAARALKTEERIAALETALEIKDRRIDELEAANNEKDMRITTLQCEVDVLRAKVEILEGRKR